MQPRVVAIAMFFLATLGCNSESDPHGGAESEVGSGATNTETGLDSDGPGETEGTSVDEFDMLVLGNSFRSFEDNTDGQSEGAILSFVAGETPSLWVQLSAGGVAITEWEMFLNSYELTVDGPVIVLTSTDLGYEGGVGAEELIPPKQLEISFRSLGPETIEVNLNIEPGVLEPLPFESDWRVYEVDEYEE